jgi:serine/threonine protein kinase
VTQVPPIVEFDPPLSGEDEVPAGLLAEVRLLSRLDHPNVVRPVGIDGHRLVVEPSEGESLEELLAESWRRRIHLPIRVAVRITLDALAGLQAIHELADDGGRTIGLVHRDVSARNVLVGREGVARIANLGVARRRGYMELVRGHHIERRADLFAAAVILWECLARRRLVDDEVSPVTRLDQVRPDVPRAIAGVCARALERDVTWRHPSAAELAEALERAALDADALGSHAEVASTVEVLRDLKPLPSRRRGLAAGTDRKPAEEAPRAVPPPPPRSSLPAAFGKYDVTRHLADGGMAQVYLARTSGIEGFEKTVVIKRLRPELAANGWATELFLQEARIAATLEHPQIAQVYDVGEEDGSYFLAMEHVSGQDLRMLIKVARRRQQSVPLEVSLRVVAELCGALHYAHEKGGPDGAPLGLVHRDVSPSNVLISYDGAVKLCDFGIAEVTAARGEPVTRVRAGKLSYMSPEQCRGDAIDRRSDIFVLAIVLWELTTLHKLFKGASEREVMRQIVEGRARRPSEIRADYPPELERIVMKGLAVEPGDRYSTAQEMMIDLEAFGRERRLALSSLGIAHLMDDLFPPGVRGAELTGADVETDLEYAEIIEVRAPRPRYRAWLAAAILAALATGATFLLDRTPRVSGEAIAAGVERITDRMSSRVGAARARVAAIASTPMLRAAVTTDARTLQDMVAHERIFTLAPGEVLEVLQRRGDRVGSLLRVPAGAAPIAPVETGASRLDRTGEGLRLTVSAALEPLYSDGGVGGQLVLASPIATGEIAADLPRLASAPASIGWLPGARRAAIGLALASLLLYLVGRRRFRCWRKRS